MTKAAGSCSIYSRSSARKLTAGKALCLSEIEWKGKRTWEDERGLDQKENRLLAIHYQGFSGGLGVKNPPANAGDAGDVGSLSWEDPLEEEMATYSSILA